MSEDALRREIVAVAQALDLAGFCPSKSGNVSARHGAGLLITPSGLPYARMTPEDLIHLSLDGVVLAGRGKPSSEWPFHTEIYKARPDAQAIVHTHSPRATALACARRGVPAFHYMIALCGGPDIRCADYATFGTPELAENAVRGLEGRKAVLLANHGVIALGDMTYQDTFCGGGKKVDEALERCSARKVGDRLEIDASEQPLPDEEALTWIEGWKTKI